MKRDEQARRYEEAMRDRRPVIPDFRPAREVNRNGSPDGRVTSDAPDTSRGASLHTDAGSHRRIILRGIASAGTAGLTSIEAAALLPLTAQGGPQVSNRAASRLGELWELGLAAIERERGACVLGACHPHAKERRVIHKPTAECALHGKARTRGGASVWRLA